MQITRAFVVAAILATVACAEPLEFPDWTIPVPEATRIIEYAHVPMEDRTERIELVQDLIIGGDPDDPAGAFYQPWGTAVDQRGNVYVLDAGNHRIQVFDRDGGFLRSIGRRGQGPGEMETPTSIVIAGGKIVVADRSTSRLSFWTADGTYLNGVALFNRLADVSGLADGSLVGRYLEIDPDRPRRTIPPLRMVFVRVSAEGTEQRRYAALPSLSETPLAMPLVPRLTNTPSGDLYVMRGDRYQVLALDTEGNVRWALRTTWPLLPVPQRLIDEAMEGPRTPNLDPSIFDWPENIPALSAVRVDGHGHVWVFPYAPLALAPESGATPSPTGDVPVDVYTRDGDRLFSGLIGSDSSAWVGWHAAHGDFVFTMRRRPDNEEMAVVRYRLVEPFG